MAIEFIVSRAGTKKDEYILEKIKRQVTKDPLAGIIVLVPPQATLMTENHIMRSLGLPGLMGVQVMGPEKLTQRILDSVWGRAKPVIDAPAKSMVVKLLLDTYMDRLPALSACARIPGVSSSIAKVISEFKSWDISAAQLQSLYFGDAATDLKLKDLAFLYEKFNEYLSKRTFTIEDRMNIAIDHAQDCRFIAGSDVFILHYDLFTSQMARLIAQIARTAKNTFITFSDASRSDPDAGLFEAVRNERLALKQLIGGVVTEVELPGDTRTDEIAHIEKNLYAYPFAAYQKECRNIQIIKALSPPQEVWVAAEIIATLVWEQGYAMREIALVCANPQDYADEIKNKFERAGIPYFLDDKRKAGENFIAGFILSALEMAGGRLSKEKLLAHIEFAWGLSSPYVSILKNYVFQKVSNAYQLEKPLLDADAEEARIKCVAPAFLFKQKIADADTAGEKIAVLQEYMNELRLEERLGAALKDFDRLGMFEAAQYFEQAYQKIWDILAEAKDILGGVQASAHELAGILKSGFESASISLIPQGADEVVVGDINILRAQDIRALIVLGVNEGKIPNYNEEPGILLPREKDFILAQVLHRNSASAIAKQKLAVYRMFSLPAEKLIVSYSVCSGGEQLQPSMLISRLHRLFGVRETDANEIIGTLRENAVMLAAEEIRNLADGYQNKSKEYIARLLERPDTRDSILQYQRFAARTNAARRLSQNFAAELYGKGYASASRFEAYYSCPFRHYVLFGLRAQVPRECTLANVDVGNFVHGVMDSVSKSLKNSGQDWKDVSQGDLVHLLRESAQAVCEQDFKYRVSPRNMNVLRAVERELYWALGAIRHHFESSCLQMEETEHHFNLDIGGVRLKGVIDRLDIARIGDETWFKIVDYKTGDKDWSLQDFVEGLSLQLVIYMLAGMEYVKQTFLNPKPAGADYFMVKLPLLEEYDSEKIISQFKMQGLQGVEPEVARQVYGFDGSGIVSLSLRLKKDGTYHAGDLKDVYTQDEIAKMLEYAKKLILRAAGEIELGNTAVAPRPNEKNVPPCAYCDFRSVCMLDEAQIPGKKEKRTRDTLLSSINGDSN